MRSHTHQIIGKEEETNIVIMISSAACQCRNGFHFQCQKNAEALSIMWIQLKFGRETATASSVYNKCKRRKRDRSERREQGTERDRRSSQKGRKC